MMNLILFLESVGEKLLRIKLFYAISSILMCMGI